MEPEDAPVYGPHRDQLGYAGRPRTGRWGGGPLGDARVARGPSRVSPAPFPCSGQPNPQRCSGLGGDRIAGLISLAGAAEAEKVGHCRLPAPCGAPSSRSGGRGLCAYVRSEALALSLGGGSDPQSRPPFLPMASS